MSAAEMMILLLVGIVVVGPKQLPTMMRSAGKWVSKLRRMSTDLRSQSGIDRILREEGLENEIRELKALRASLSKQAILDTLVAAAEEAQIPAKRPTGALPSIQAEPRAPVLGEGALGANGASNGSGTPSGELGTEAARADAMSGAAVGGALAAQHLDGAVVTPSAVGSDGSAIMSRVELKPSPFSVSRSPKALPAPFDTRLREYPEYGVDHYDAIPDDLAPDEPESSGEAPSSMSLHVAPAGALTPPEANAENPPSPPDFS